MVTLPSGTPLGRLKVVKVYQSFDGPKLFSCENASGQKYLAFWLGDEDDIDRWLYLPLSDSRLGQVRAGTISLRQACLNSEDGFVWLVSVPMADEDPASVETVAPALLPNSDLPAEDSFLTLAPDKLPCPE